MAFRRPGAGLSSKEPTELASSSKGIPSSESFASSDEAQFTDDPNTDEHDLHVDDVNTQAGEPVTGGLATEAGVVGEGAGADTQATDEPVHEDDEAEYTGESEGEGDGDVDGDEGDGPVPPQPPEEGGDTTLDGEEPPPPPPEEDDEEDEESEEEEMFVSTEEKKQEDLASLASLALAPEDDAVEDGTGAEDEDVTDTEVRLRKQTEILIKNAVEAQSREVDEAVPEDKKPRAKNVNLDDYRNVGELIIFLLHATSMLSFRNTFFLTLHYFAKVNLVLDRLLDVLNYEPPKESDDENDKEVNKEMNVAHLQNWENIKLKAFTLLTYWATTYCHDLDKKQQERLRNTFREYPPKEWVEAVPKDKNEVMGKLIEKAANFSKNFAAASKELSKLNSNFMSKTSAFKEFFTNIESWRREPPSDLCPLEERIKFQHDEEHKYSMGEGLQSIILKLTVQQIAVCLCFFSFRRMSYLDGPRDLLKGPRKINNVPSQMKLSNRFSCWVASEVLRCDSDTSRGKLFGTFVKIAQASYLLRNYTTVLEITFGLNHNSVHRLRGSGKGKGGLLSNLSRRTRALYDAICAFSSPADNYRKYRTVTEANNSKNEAFVPYFGVLFKDCVTIEERGKPMKFQVEFVEEKQEVALDHSPLSLTYVLWDKCEDISKMTYEVFHQRNHFPQDLDVDKECWQNIRFQEQREKIAAQKAAKGEIPPRNKKGFGNLECDTAMQMSLLASILRTMDEEKLDARSFEILPRKTRGA